MKGLLLASLLAVPSLAFGQAHPAPKRPPTTQLIFDTGDDIDGARDAPDLTLIQAEPHPHHSPLIQIRSDFKDKVLASASEM
jgi:hypothetical protein